MHPAMLPSLVAERHRDIAASMPPRRAPAPARRPARTGPGCRERSARRRLPFLRVTWSRVALAAQPGGAAGRSRSWVIVISATRPL